MQLVNVGLVEYSAALRNKLLQAYIVHKMHAVADKPL